MPSLPSIRPSDARGRQSSAFVREDSGRASGSALPHGLSPLPRGRHLDCFRGGEDKAGLFQDLSGPNEFEPPSGGGDLDHAHEDGRELIVSGDIARSIFTGGSIRSEENTYESQSLMRTS